MKSESKYEKLSYVLALVAIVLPYALAYDMMTRHEEVIIRVRSCTFRWSYGITIVSGYRQIGDTEKITSVVVKGIYNETFVPDHTYYVELRGRNLLNVTQVN